MPWLEEVPKFGLFLCFIQGTLFKEPYNIVISLPALLRGGGDSDQRFCESGFFYQEGGLGLGKL